MININDTTIKIIEQVKLPTWTQSTPAKNGWFFNSSEPPPTQPNLLSTSLWGGRDGVIGGKGGVIRGGRVTVEGGVKVEGGVIGGGGE